jgi:hypothetical protein
MSGQTGLTIAGSLSTLEDVPFFIPSIMIAMQPRSLHTLLAAT